MYVGTHALPDMNALALGVARPRASCVHIRQCTPAHVTTTSCVTTWLQSHLLMSKFICKRLLISSINGPDIYINI